MEPLEYFTLLLKTQEVDFSKEIVVNELLIQIIDNDSELWLFLALLYIFIIF